METLLRILLLLALLFDILVHITLTLLRWTLVLAWWGILAGLALAALAALIVLAIHQGPTVADHIGAAAMVAWGHVGAILGLGVLFTLLGAFVSWSDRHHQS